MPILPQVTVSNIESAVESEASLGHWEQIWAWIQVPWVFLK